MKHRPATRKDHQRFCVTEGWVKRTTATGKTGTHHVNYELTLPGGTVLFTRICHPVDRSDYGARLWSHILRDQLAVTEDEFWRCVNDRVKPQRGAEPNPVLHPGAIPVGVIVTLAEQSHIPEEQVRSMTKEQAIERMLSCYAQQEERERQPDWRPGGRPLTSDGRPPRLAGQYRLRAGAGKGHGCSPGGGMLVRGRRVQVPPVGRLDPAGESWLLSGS